MLADAITQKQKEPSHTDRAEVNLDQASHFAQQLRKRALNRIRWSHKNAEVAQIGDALKMQIRQKAGGVTETARAAYTNGRSSVRSWPWLDLSTAASILLAGEASRSRPASQPDLRKRAMNRVATQV